MRYAAAALMIKRSLESIAGIWLAGLLVLLPVALTLAVLAYAFNLMNRLLGPGSFVGRFFAALARRAEPSPQGFLARLRHSNDEERQQEEYPCSRSIGRHACWPASSG